MRFGFGKRGDHSRDADELPPLDPKLTNYQDRDPLEPPRTTSIEDLFRRRITGTPGRGWIRRPR